MSRTIRLVGPEAQSAATELRAQLLSIEATPPELDIDVRKHGLDPVAVVGLVFGGISTADVVWKWWTKYKSTGLRLLLTGDDGREQELTSSGEQTFKNRLDIDVDVDVEIADNAGEEA